MSQPADNQPFLAYAVRKRQLVEAFLKQPVPRPLVPREFIDANRPTWLGENLVGAVLTFIVVNSLLWWFMLKGNVLFADDFGSGFITQLFWSLVILTHTIAPLALILTLCWRRIQGTRKRRKLLQDGILVEGNVDELSRTGKTGRHPDEKQYRASFTYCWRGVNRQASQLLYCEAGFQGFDFGHYDKTFPANLLVNPDTPGDVLWADATLLSSALNQNGPGGD